MQEAAKKTTVQFVRSGGVPAAPSNAEEIDLDEDEDEEGGKEAGGAGVEEQSVPEAVFGELGARARLATLKHGPE